MLDKNRHKIVMLQILKDIYSETSISSLLGFKGGTAAYLFFELPRFSVDLDFDLIEDSSENKEKVFDKVRRIISKYGEIKDEAKKNFTLLFSISYQKGEHQLKVEINLRNTGAQYEIRNYLGIPMLVAKKESLAAGKLIALTSRKNFAGRDLYDAYFFLKNNWGIDENVIKEYGKDSVESYMRECLDFVEKLPSDGLLKGLGELVDEEDKDFIRNKLKNEVVFLLRAYVANNN